MDNIYLNLFLVRTWDGGKSHLTKQVEDDKRAQRKRTADDLLDEELDKGKVRNRWEKNEPPFVGLTIYISIFAG